MACGHSTARLLLGSPSSLPCQSLHGSCMYAQVSPEEVTPASISALRQEVLDLIHGKMAAAAGAAGGARGS